MAEESRLFIIDRKVVKDETGRYPDFIWGNPLAVFDMACMGESFKALFKNDIDFALDGYSEEDLTVDNYGEKVKSCPFEPVIEWLKEEMKHNDYRRLPPLLSFLEAFNPEQWNELLIVRYGY